MKVNIWIDKKKHEYDGIPPNVGEFVSIHDSNGHMFKGQVEDRRLIVIITENGTSVSWEVSVGSLKLV